MGGLILWASQTGTSEAIAKQIFTDCVEKKLDVAIQRIDDKLLPETLKTYSTLVFVLSSTGEGDPPDHSIRFNTKLRLLYRKNQKSSPEELPFRDISFTVLGLGDSNYSSFQTNPKAIHQYVSGLGAKEFYPRGSPDEVKGLEEQVEQWIEGLWNPLAQELARSFPSEPAPVSAPAPASAPSETEETQSLPTEPPAAPKEPTAEKAPEPASAKPKPASKPRAKIQIKSIPSVPPVTVALLPSENTIDVDNISGPNRSEHQAKSITLTTARWLTSPSAIKQVVEFTFSLPSDFPSYVPGDSVGIYCPNPSSLVEGVLAHLGCDGDQVFELNLPKMDPKLTPSHLQELFPNSVRTIFQWGCDLTSAPKKTFLRMLAEHCSDPTEKASLIHLSSMKGKTDYDNQILANRPSLLDLFQLFPSCKPSLEHLFSCLPPMQPRYYSYACSPLARPSSEVTVVLSLVEISTANQSVPQYGICSHWLTQLAIKQGFLDPTGRYSLPIPEFDIQGNELKFSGFHRPSVHFHLPSDVENLRKPIIMIGPGTGVAPFIGFLEHFQAQSIELSPFEDKWLFFGCRTQADDYLYQEKLSGFVTDGVLNQLVVAFSRESNSITYVQHKLLEHAEQISDLLLNQDAFMFVCGDAKGMAKGVNDALKQLLLQSNHTESQAMEAITNLLKHGRLVFDVWF